MISRVDRVDTGAWFGDCLGLFDCLPVGCVWLVGVCPGAAGVRALVRVGVFTW